MLFITIFYNFCNLLYYPLTCSFPYFYTIKEVTIKYEHFEISNLCMKTCAGNNPSKSANALLAKLSFYRSVCDRFFPFAHSFDYAAKGQVWRKTWARSMFETWVQNTPIFFFFLFSIMLFLTRKNHRRSDWWKS